MYYHFSEDPAIERFVPRHPKSAPHLPPIVWAIDHEHSVHYYFPRDCPRVIYTKTDSATPDDIARFFDGSTADKIIAVESGWLERIRCVQLYMYTFAETSFTSNCDSAGYYTSQETIVPIAVEPVGDLLTRIAETGAELRITPSLVPLRKAVIASSLKFSIIRFANAVQ